MGMPETAVNEDHGPELRQRDVGFAGQILAVQPVAIAHPVQSTSNQHLRLRIRAFNRSHVAATLLRRVYVRHAWIAVSFVL